MHKIIAYIIIFLIIASISDSCQKSRWASERDKWRQEEKERLYDLGVGKEKDTEDRYKLIGVTLYTLSHTLSKKEADGVVYFGNNFFGERINNASIVTVIEFGLPTDADSANEVSKLQDARWTYSIPKYEYFIKPTSTILSKFIEIEDRLFKAYQNKNHLIAKYGKDFSSQNIDADIKHLNDLAWQLVEPTKKFFATAKQHMMKIDEANARAETMQGLNTFTQEIEAAGHQPSEALEQSVADITAAVNNLEKALNE